MVVLQVNQSFGRRKSQKIVIWWGWFGERLICWKCGEFAVDSETVQAGVLVVSPVVVDLHPDVCEHIVVVLKSGKFWLLWSSKWWLKTSLYCRIFCINSQAEWMSEMKYRPDRTQISPKAWLHHPQFSSPESREMSVVVHCRWPSVWETFMTGKHHLHKQKTPLVRCWWIQGIVFL